MNKKQVVFIVLLTIVNMVLWIVGEILIIAVMHFGFKATIIWSVAMIGATIGISMWNSFRDHSDENSRKW